MEVALIISSLAGAASAVTINKLPKRNKITLLGANSHIKAQIDTLRIEKDILTKTISRLYSDSPDLTKIQRDKLLVRYQHQLGVILAKIEKLEQASKHPDLGPLGDGLITLMDQKLSALDKRLVEISSKISAQTQIEKPQIKKEEPKKAEIKEVEKVPEKIIERPEIVRSETVEELIKSFAKPTRRFELTTLTEIPTEISVIPINEARQDLPEQIQTPQIVPPKVPEQIPQPEIKVEKTEMKQEQLFSEPINIEKQVRSEPPKLEFKSSEPEKKKPKLNIPEPEEVDDDEDDLDSIKLEIMKTLSKLEQAEVE
ncbi:MAG TPA: hypothetical protein VFM64_02090 [Candidatus Nitrosotenuis sp.]|nr:hypothetical protein [Candidatus Nitrosotenuis sp.]